VVGEYTSPEIEALFKQRTLFQKDLAKVTADAKKEKNENEPYVERRGRKKIPKDVNEKKALFLDILKRRIKQKVEQMTVNEVDDKCFKCGEEGELLFCDNNGCPRGYHLPCVNKTVWPTGKVFSFFQISLAASVLNFLTLRRSMVVSVALLYSVPFEESHYQVFRMP
jgi:hypothetical protein